MRYLAKEQDHEFVSEFGAAIYGKGHSFRQEDNKRLDNYHSAIKRVLKGRFMNLPDRRAESLRTAFQQAEWALRPRDIDPFETFGDLDNRSAD